MLVCGNECRARRLCFVLLWGFFSFPDGRRSFRCLVSFPGILTLLAGKIRRVKQEEADINAETGSGYINFRSAGNPCLVCSVSSLCLDLVLHKGARDPVTSANPLWNTCLMHQDSHDRRIPFLTLYLNWITAAAMPVVTATRGSLMSALYSVTKA